MRNEIKAIVFCKNSCKKDTLSGNLKLRMRDYRNFPRKRSTAKIVLGFIFFLLHPTSCIRCPFKNQVKFPYVGSNEETTEAHSRPCPVSHQSRRQTNPNFAYSAQFLLSCLWVVKRFRMIMSLLTKVLKSPRDYRTRRNNAFKVGSQEGTIFDNRQFVNHRTNCYDRRRWENKATSVIRD